MKTMKPPFKPILTASAVVLCTLLWIPASAAADTNRPTEPGFSGTIKTPAWTEPDQVLPSLRYDAIPLAEVVEHLRDQFKNQFDVVLPSSVMTVNPSTGSAEPLDVQSVLITLRLQNVRAGEIFNAMNLLFAANGDPVRWELLMNGTRPTAVLQLAQSSELEPARSAAEPRKRMVFFVGDIVEDGRAGMMTWKEFLKTVLLMCEETFGHQTPIPTIATHPPASLLVVSGTQEQLDFVRNMLEALKEKAKLDAENKAQSASAKPVPQTGDSAKR